MRILFFPFLSFSDTQLQRHLRGKTVLITGASYGIGECLVTRLAGTQAELLLVARTKDKLVELKQRVESQGGHAEIFPCDLRNAVEVQALINTLQQRPGGIDIFVSNAGKSIRRSIFDSLDRYHDFTRTMYLNYFAPVQLMLGLIPALVARRGQVINISAVNVLLIPTPQWSAYQASKTAFDQWFRCVSPELNAQNVRTTSIYLPLVRTRMIEPTLMYRHLPAMQPQQVAQLICQAMLSRRSTYAPWWLLIGQLGSVLFRSLWEIGLNYYCKHK
uniref:Short-chain dehydrogenase/reductase SDR n=1 Tax=Cyanothece sp. (strain PCC 7425 / ATCC 29141) TaxID=395961 RepID=B8HZ73_CYAP4